ncbi:MAG: hypothetical protein GXP56_06445 [Deltaproteobacteria bacterium]|nr:hypothetical protein [Deltaproteobacteria bacterium]
MYTRKQALALARQLRTCPTPDIRNDADYIEENKRHNEICPFCSTDIKDEIDSWSILSEKYQKKFKAPATEMGDRQVTKGQLWKLNKNMCCWREGYYYNAPVILVIKDHNTANNEILAAQTWHDIYLASPGDMVVPETHRTGVDEFFIETWNFYILKKHYLGRYLGNVTGEVVEYAMKMHANQDILPGWAPRLMALRQNDPRHYFQKLEIKTGHLMEQQAANIPGFANDSTDSFISKIKAAMDGLEWIWQPETIIECLALLKFTPESVALSASTKNRNEIIATFFCLRGEKIQTVKSVECLIFHEKSSSGGYTVTGEIQGLSAGTKELSFMCFIADKKNKYLSPGKWTWDDNSQQFLAQFNRVKGKNERVSILIINQVNGKDRP